MKPPTPQREQPILPISSIEAQHQQPDHDLTAALQQQAHQQQRLHQFIGLATLILAPILSVMVANQNLYSLLATLLASGFFLIAAGIYQRSLIGLLVVVLVFCLTDNLLSHQGQFDLPHLLLQLGTLSIFTLLFRLAKPYVWQIFNKIRHKS